MPCYHPLAVRYIDGKFAGFVGPYTPALHSDTYGEYVRVPCGHCVGCRIDRAKRWSDRMLLEFDTVRDYGKRKALFLTLTYDPEHLPLVTCTDKQVRGNLRQKDMQDFLKRIRKKFSDRKLRYFYSGEYGDQTFRPHYHMIMYGCTLDDFPDAEVYSYDSKMQSSLYVSSILDSIWKNGSVKFAPATYGTFSYVGKYVLKKQWGDNALFYRGRTPPFCRMSLKPALGSDFFGPDISYTKVCVPDPDGDKKIHEIELPRVVLDKLRASDPDLYDNIMAVRRAIAQSHSEMREQQSDLDFFSQLRLDEQRLKDKIKSTSHRDKV